MATNEQLRQVLATMPGVVEASVVGDRALIATVVSASFRDQNEAERQETVWSYVRRQLGSEELDNVEFILHEHPGGERGVAAGAAKRRRLGPSACASKCLAVRPVGAA